VATPEATPLRPRLDTQHIDPAECSGDRGGVIRAAIGDHDDANRHPGVFRLSPISSVGEGGKTTPDELLFITGGDDCAQSGHQVGHQISMPEPRLAVRTEAHKR
jgi:hypothetical protein